MRSWIASAALLWCVVTGSSAHAAGHDNPFQRLPRLHPAYLSVRQLEAHGYVTGSPTGSFGTLKERTRYEFAIATERMYRSLKPRVLEATTSGTLREDLRALRGLMHEFEPEIAALGLDTTDIDLQLNTMDARLVKLESLERSANSPTQVASGGRGENLLARNRSLGVMAALRRPFLMDTLSGANWLDLTRSPADLGGSQAGTHFGPASVGVHLNQPDPLVTMPRLPLQGANPGLGFGAQLDLSMGSYLLSAFYNREGALADRFRLWNPYFPMGPLEGAGGSLSGPLSRTLGFQLETATFSSLETDPTQLLYFKGGVQYALNSRLKLLLGYEWMRKLGTAGDAADGAAYLFGLGQSIGSNIHLNLLFRSQAPTHGSGVAGAAGEAPNSSAITQISVRF